MFCTNLGLGQSFITSIFLSSMHIFLETSYILKSKPHSNRNNTSLNWQTGHIFEVDLELNGQF